MMHHPFFFSNCYNYLNYLLLMTRCIPRRNLSRITYLCSFYWTQMRNNFIYFVRYFIFRLILLSFFHRSLCPEFELGASWSMAEIISFNPLLNTAILLTSRITVTWTHHRLIENINSQRTQGLFLTVLLGVDFFNFTS